MSASLHLIEDDAPVVNVQNPYEYRKQVDLAMMIARFLCVMPLGEIARIADDMGKWPLLMNRKDEGLRRECETMEVLNAAHKQLLKIAARYGE